MRRIRKIGKKLLAWSIVMALMLGNMSFVQATDVELLNASGKDAYTDEDSRQVLQPIVEYHQNPLYTDESSTGAIGWQLRSSSMSGYVEPDVYYTSVEEAALAVREQIVNREETIEIGIQTTGDINTLLNEVMELVFVHTGNPIEGDYLDFQYKSWAGSLACYTKRGVQYCKLTYTMLYYTTAEQEAEMDEAVAEVLTELALEGKTDYQKICAIYDYICENITYDYANLNDTTYYLKHTAYAALIHKTAVCQGYAVLLYRLLLESGIDSRIVVGVANNDNHAWNIVRLNDVYYLLDSTWDAGKTTYNYFLKCEENFLHHTTDEQFLTDEFRELYPIAESDHSAEDEIEYEAYGFRYKLLNGVATILSYLGAERNVVVPSEIGGCQVGKIAGFAFSSCTELESLSLPSSEIQIGTDAFYDCSVVTIAGTEQSLLHTGGAPTCSQSAECEQCLQCYYDKTEHAETKLCNQKTATCTQEGYTGDSCCKSCGEVLEEGTVIAMTAHSGGKATCVEKAVCTVCQSSYGELDKENHVESKLCNQVAATTETEGYTGDVCCKACGIVLEAGKVIPVMKEDDQTSTGEVITPDTGDGETPSTGEVITPDTGDGETPSTGEAITPDTGDGENPSTGEAITPTTGQAVMLGDVDFDQSVSLEDAQIVLRLALGIMKPDTYMEIAADVNEDKGISLVDAQIVLKMALGIDV